MTSRRGLPRGLDMFLVVLLAAAPLLPALLTGRTLFYRDIGQYYLANRYLTVSAIHDGHVPLWNPQRNNGQPFLANPNSFVLRPTTLLFLPFPARLVHIPMTLSVIALLAVAGLGTRALLLDCGLSRAASLVGAAAFSLSGCVQSLSQLQNHLEGVAFLPLTLWALRRSFLRGWNPWGVVAGLSFGLLVSAGEPVWIVVAAMGALALPGSEGIEPRRALRPAAVAVAFGLLVASAQLLPLMENVLHSERGRGLLEEDVLKWSMPPQALLQTFIPGLWGDPTRLAPDAYWGTWLFDSSLPWLLSIHLGAPILVLAAAGAWAKRRGAGGRAATLAAIGVALALGSSTPLYPFLVKWIPGAANVRFPIKWFLLTAWCAAILAASGFDHLMARVRPRGGRGESVGLLSAAAAFGLGVVMALGALPSFSRIVRAMFDVPPAVTDDVLAHGAVRTIGSSLAMAAGSILLLLLFRPRDAASAPIRSRLAAGLCCAILWFGARGLQPSAPIEAVFDPSPFLKAMPEVMAGRLRFFGFPRPPGFAFRTPSPEYAAAAGLPPDSLAWGMRWDVRTLRYATIFPWGVKGAYDRTGDSRLDLLPGSALSLKLKEGGVTLPEAVRLLSASSVGYLLAHAELDHPDLSEVASLPGESNVPVKLYKLASPVPRAELVERAEEVASFDEALGKIGSGAADPHAVVLLGPIPGGGAGIEGPAASGGGVPGISGSATITRDDPCEVDVRVKAGRPAWLVLTDTFESTWRARLDGAAVPILRANAMFRSIKVPAGDHEVVFSYLPLSIVLGCGISLLSIALGVGVIVAGRRPRAS